MEMQKVEIYWGKNKQKRYSTTSASNSLFICFNIQMSFALAHEEDVEYSCGLENKVVEIAHLDCNQNPWAWAKSHLSTRFWNIFPKQQQQRQTDIYFRSARFIKYHPDALLADANTPSKKR